MANRKKSVSTPSSYFEYLYKFIADPWDFQNSQYEAAKYKATLAALPRARYQSALEIGCSIGVFTYQLAARCEALLAIDTSHTALQKASRRCQDLPQVHFELGNIPHQFPIKNYDLIIFSEVGYYLGWRDLRQTKQQILQHLAPEGHLLMVHSIAQNIISSLYTPLTGDLVHEAFLEEPKESLEHLLNIRNDRYRLDLFQRR